MAATKRKAPAGAAPGAGVPPTRSLREMGLEVWRPVELHRRDVKEAPYNPRVMTDEEKRRLRKGLRRHGLVQPVVWNRRTGTLVGGHQRLSQLDALAGTPDYTLTVAEIDVPPAREREINLILNNPGAQGDWDLDKLGALLRDTSTENKLDLDGAGFDVADVYRMFGDSPFETRPDDLAGMAEKLRASVEAQEEGRASAAARDSQHFYLVVVFRDDADRVAFTDALGLPDNRFQDGRRLRELLGGGTGEGDGEEV